MDRAAGTEQPCWDSKRPHRRVRTGESGKESQERRTGTRVGIGLSGQDREDRLARTRTEWTGQRISVQRNSDRKTRTRTIESG
jgi:hypothetical protein